MSQFSVSNGSTVWYADNKQGWLSGEVMPNDESANMQIICVEGGNKGGPTKDFGWSDIGSSVFIRNIEDDFPNDLIQLKFLHEPGVLDAMRLRFIESMVYTYTGNICISMNPYKWLPLYGEDVMQQYMDVEEMKQKPPHIFSVAQKAYTSMMAGEFRKNQSILVSGESGAGKTEATKIMMTFLGYLSDQRSHQLSDMDKVHATVSKVIESNPLLEAFGNAKTVRNNNSSRFGKWIEIQFNSKGCMCGAAIKTYLLEKFRVVHQNENERNFHVFYQLVKGADKELREKLMLDENLTDFRFLNGGGCVMVDRMDDAHHFQKTQQAMTTIGLSDIEQYAAWRIVAAVLHLGEVTFETDQAENTSVTNMDVLGRAAILLELDPVLFSDALCNATLIIRGEKTKKRLNKKQAMDTRNSLCKMLYGRLFDWLVGKVNLSLQSKHVQSFVGILDIFGFETFNVNSLEQLFINYTNEALQQQFIGDFFKTVQQEYKEEGIEWSYVDFVDNQECLDLIAAPQGNSVLGILNETCKVSGDDTQYLRSVLQLLRSNRCFIAPKTQARSFSLKHFAATVEYTVEGFVDKNKEPLSEDIRSIIADIDARVLRETDEKSKSTSQASSETVYTKFKSNLNMLLQAIRDTGIHYVRCIQPNSVQSPTLFEKMHALRQLRYSGVLSAIQMSQSGYPNRLDYHHFAARFQRVIGLVCGPNDPVSELQKDCMFALKQQFPKLGLNFNDKKLMQFGLTRIYFGKGVLERLEELRAKLRDEAVSLLQRVARMRSHRKIYRARQVSVVRIQTVIRQFVQAKVFREKVTKVLVIQSQMRNFFAAKQVQSVRETQASKVLQTFGRAITCRASLIAKQNAILLLQCRARRLSRRRQFLKRLAKKREELDNQSKEQAWREKQRLEELVRQEREAREAQDRKIRELEALLMARDAASPVVVVAPPPPPVVAEPRQSLRVVADTGGEDDDDDDNHDHTVDHSGHRLATVPSQPPNDDDDDDDDDDNAANTSHAPKEHAVDRDAILAQLRKEMEAEKQKLLEEQAKSMREQFEREKQQFMALAEVQKEAAAAAAATATAAAVVAATTSAATTSAATTSAPSTTTPTPTTATPKDTKIPPNPTFPAAAAVAPTQTTPTSTTQTAPSIPPPPKAPSSPTSQLPPADTLDDSQQKFKQPPRVSIPSKPQPSDAEPETDESAFRWNQKNSLNVAIALSEHDRKAVKISRQPDVSILLSDNSFSDGVWSWELEIEYLSPNSMFWFGITNMPQLVAGAPQRAIARNRNVWSMAFGPIAEEFGFNFQGQLTPHTTTDLRTEDRISIELDISSSTVRFFLNNYPCGKCKTLPPNAKWFPFIALDDKSDAVSLLWSHRGHHEHAKKKPLRMIRKASSAARRAFLPPKQDQVKPDARRGSLIDKVSSLVSTPATAGGSTSAHENVVRTKPSTQTPKSPPKLLHIDLSEVNPQDLRKYRATFKVFDADGDGLVDRYEFGEALKKFKLQSHKEFTQEKCDDLFFEIDINGDGRLDFGEFVTWIVNLKRQKRDASSNADDAATSSNSHRQLAAGGSSVTGNGVNAADPALWTPRA